MQFYCDLEFVFLPGRIPVATWIPPVKHLKLKPKSMVISRGVLIDKRLKIVIPSPASLGYSILVATSSRALPEQN